MDKFNLPHSSNTLIDGITRYDTPKARKNTSDIRSAGASTYIDSTGRNLEERTQNSLDSNHTEEAESVSAIESYKDSIIEIPTGMSVIYLHYFLRTSLTLIKNEIKVFEVSFLGAPEPVTRGIKEAAASVTRCGEILKYAERTAVHKNLAYGDGLCADTKDSLEDRLLRAAEP
jgi:hypothetical protein